MQRVIKGKSNKMYIIIGANGFLGSYCIKNILKKTNDTIIATYSKAKNNLFKNDRLTWKKVDVCDIDSLKQLACCIDTNSKIIYLAAFHDPDKVEEFPELAWKINIIAFANAVSILGKAKCFYYSSSDTVYGEGTVYKKFIESDKYAPINLYGKHKALAEQICLTKGYNVIRFPFIFGPSLLEGRPHFFDNIKQNLVEGKSVKMFYDSYRSTLSFDMANS